MQVRIRILVTYTAAQLAALLLASVMAGFANVGLGFEDTSFVTGSVEASIVYLGAEFIGAFIAFYVQALREPQRYWVEASQVAVTTPLIVTAVNVLTTPPVAWYWVLLLRLVSYSIVMGLAGLAKSTVQKVPNDGA